jgi:ABC-type uncharacterized transport system substrate-binding protein
VAVVFELRAFENDWHAIQTAAKSIGIEAQPAAIASAADLNRALETALGGRPLPPTQPANAALLFYGAQLVPLFRRAGSYRVDRILRGARPADLAVEGPMVFDLTINRTTARALGLDIPAEFVAQVTKWLE